MFQNLLTVTFACFFFLHFSLYNKSKTHGGDSLNQFFMKTRRVYINYRMCMRCVCVPVNVDVSVYVRVSL